MVIMKRLFLSAALLATIILLSFTPAQAQMWSVKLGGNLSTLSGDNGVPSTAKKNQLLGWQAGIMYEAPLVKFISLEADLLWNTKGLYYKSTIGSTDIKNILDLNYVELQVLPKFHFGTESFRFYINAGPYFAYGINNVVTQKYKADDAHISTSIRQSFKNAELNAFDLGYKIGLGVEFGAIQVGLNYEGGLLKVYKADNNKTYNGVMSLTLAYRFGDLVVVGD
jgi:hypothetical protein